MNEINEVDESTKEAHFRNHMFCLILDDVIGELTVCFGAAKQIFIPSAFFGTTKTCRKKN